MIKKTITYEDFDGNERTEDFYFNLSKAEVTEMEMMEEGGMVKKLQTLIDSQDSKRLIETFKDIILKAYGEKSLDGRKFMKSPEITQDFQSTQAYSELFMELAFDAKAAAAFINGVIPDVEGAKPVKGNETKEELQQRLRELEEEGRRKKQESQQQDKSK